MFRLRHSIFGAGFLALTALLAGCTQEQAAPPANRNGTETADENLDPEVEEALADLSPADRQAALEQRICPVSEKPLGSMGTPQKITVEGREVFICCEGCDEMLRENPEEYFAKLTD